MKKTLVMMLALSGTVLVSCTQSEYLGETVQKGGNEIVFGSGTGKMSRADLTGSAAAEKLGNVMKVYGVKKTDAGYGDVFQNYNVKYDNGKSTNDEFNDGWYYVGAETGQSIKYWDYSSVDYHFVAGSPVANFTYALSATGDIEKATVTGLGGRLNRTTTVASTLSPVYIADPVVVAKADYQKEVLFTFKSMQTKVRVGIYETVPGYKITDIKFYQSASATAPDAEHYATLYSSNAAYFQGTTGAEAYLTYNWATPAYTFEYKSGDVTTGGYWEGGKFANGVPSISSADATIANLYGEETSMEATSGYFVVMPTPSATAATPLTLKCDYTLESTDGKTNEVINVKGATATIPVEYTKWAANTAYTYIFKITRNTNGTTGEPGTDPDGLFPITFDAVVVDVADGMLQGTETTLSTPSITVYQDGDVVANGVQFKEGEVTVKAMEGTTEATSSYTWSYQTLTGAFDYTLGYEAQAGPWTDGLLTTVAAGKTYLIKATKTDDKGTADTSDDVTTTAYFVLVVGAAEEGPTNP